MLAHYFLSLSLFFSIISTSSTYLGNKDQRRLNDLRKICLWLQHHHPQQHCHQMKSMEMKIARKTSNVMLAIEVQSRAKEISRICGS